MCGLVGVIGDIDYKAKKAFHYLHHFDVLRGRDGAGIYLFNKDGKGKLLKGTHLPEDLFWLYPKEFDMKNLISDVNLTLIMGHNRAATVGTISPENAHPFEFDRIVGAHNGTITKSSLYHFPGYHLDKIDSEIMFSCINAWTEGKTTKYAEFQTIVNEANGAMALTWFDKAKRTLNIYRNAERELFLAMSKDRSQLFWASEKWMLQVACGRAGIEIDSVVPYPEHRLTAFKMKNKAGKIRIKVCKEEKIEKKVVPLPLPDDTDKDWEHSFWGHNREFTPPRHGRGHNSRVVENFTPSGSKFVVFNEAITIKEFEHRVKLGCSICYSGLSYADRLTIKWVDKSSPICSTCQKGSLVDWMSPGEINMLEEGKDVH